MAAKRQEVVVAKSDDNSASDIRKCTFTLQIEAAVETGAFETPGFRFRFLDGSRKQTSAIGSGSGWTPVHDSESPESSAAPPARFRFEQSFPDVAITNSFATALDDDPVLSLFLFDHPGLAGVGSTPRAQGKDAKPSTVKTTAVAPQVATPAVEFVSKAFAGLYEIDVSSLLAGHLSVKQVWSQGPIAESQPNQDVSVFGTKPTKTESCSVTRNICQLPSASGLKYLSVQVTTDQPLLAGEILHQLNPLTITIGTARRMPGVTYQGSGTASAHSPLHHYCKPAFALIHFFPDHLEPQPSAPSRSTPSYTLTRVLLTPGQHQSETIQWNASVTLLCGRFKKAELADAIRFAALSIEIRDRDLRQEEVMARLQSKWEGLYTTGVDPCQQTQDESHIYGNIASVAISRSGESLAATTPKPLELPIVDDIARSDWRITLAQSGKLFPYGVARFRLAELLNTAKQWMGGTKPRDDSPYMTLKLTTDVIGVKRRASPLGTTDPTAEESEFSSIVDLAPLEKVIREPGAYVTSGASLSIQVKLEYPIEIVSKSFKDAVTPPTRSENQHGDTLGEIKLDLMFSRIVVIIPYKDNATLREVAKSMATVNLKSLPGVPIRSYQMTESEKLDCESGALNVITGVQIIDNQFRMIILEGLADKGMKYIHEQLQRKRPNDPQGYRMFANDTLGFTRRLYTTFEIDLKRIKLRHSLPHLMTMPDIYMSTNVSENCHQALSRLADMRKVQGLIEVKHLDLFPTSQMLLEIESKYGESITLEDIHGTSASTLAASNSSSNPNLQNEGSNTNDGKHSERSARYHTKSLKAPTDSTNDSYDQARRNRIEKNFILERKKRADELHTEYLEKKQSIAILEGASSSPIYMYSGQKLRTQDILQDEMRTRLSNDHLATYTYSRDFQSLALSMVNPEALKQTEEQESRKKWTTQRGFIYPAPRKPEEYIKRTDAPSEARCEDLRQTFVDNVNHPKPVSRGSSQSGRKGPEFSTLPSKDMIFGGTNGNGTVNPDYFRSVHLCGEGLRLEMEEALKKEQDEWERRLVVDKKQMKFIAHGNICSQPREKPSQLDKISDILRGSARSKPIRIVRNATLPSGKRVPLDKAPVTIHNQEEFVGCVAATFASTLRPLDSKQFAATDAASGKPKDFFFPSSTSILTPPVKKFINRKEIVPMQETEKTGLFWRNE